MNTRIKMPIMTDDPDIRPAWMYTDHGANGDFYLTIVEIKDCFNKEGKLEKQPVRTTMRFATSGSQIPLEIREHITAIHRILEPTGENKYPMEVIQEYLKKNKE